LWLLKGWQIARCGEDANAEQPFVVAMSGCAGHSKSNREAGSAISGLAADRRKRATTVCPSPARVKFT
jgi:hypothetical protein